jgi:SAM-dependent methyltransferase
MLIGGLVPRMLQVVFQPEIARELAGGPRSSAELADAAGLHEPSLYRVLRAATGVGVVSEQSDGRFALTPVGQVAVDLEVARWAFGLAAIDELPQAVASAKTGMELAHGASIFEYIVQHPDVGPLFDRAMTLVHDGEKQAVVDAYDFTGVERLVDVGGGNGTFLGLLLDRYPDLQCVLFDLPPVIERGAPAVAGNADRCELVAGDFFDSLPPGADAYLLSHVIHDWDEDRAPAVLRNCREAMNPDGRLLLVEMVIPPGDEPHPGKMLDLVMMSLTGGMERSEAEYRELLDRAGLRLTQVIPTRSPVSVIEAVPANRH